MKKIIFSTLLLLVSFSSFSQDADGYVKVAKSSDGDVFSVYFEKSDGDNKEFWLKSITPIKTSKGKNGKIIKKGGDIMIRYVNMNCLDKTYNTSDYIMYDRLGNTRSELSYLDSYNERVIPGTVMNIIMDYVCDNE